MSSISSSSMHSIYCNHPKNIFKAVGKYDCILCMFRFMEMGEGLAYITDIVNYTPLHYAVYYSSMNCIKVILCMCSKLELNAKGCDGNTPLHLAIQEQNSNIATMLLEKGADPNIQNARGMNPLMEVCDTSSCIYPPNKYLVDLLIQYNCNLDTKDEHGNTSLHILSRSYDRHTKEVEEIMIALIQNGANPYEKNKENKTPMDFMNRENNDRFLNIIEKYGSFHIKNPDFD